MLKFGGSRPESDGNDAKDRERKQRHQRTAAAVVAATGASAVPGNGASAMDTNRGGGIGGAVDATSKPHQMAPPESPFGTGQPPVVSYLSIFLKITKTFNLMQHSNLFSRLYVVDQRRWVRPTALVTYVNSA